MMKRALISCLAVALSFSPPASAQDDDDDLAPLAPLGKPKPKAAKPKPKAKPKAAPAKPPPAKPGPTATSGGDDDLAPIAPIAAKGELSIKLQTVVSGAVLNIDGKDVGTLPLAPQSVPSGEHTVTVKRAGFAAFVKKVMVPGGKLTEVDAKLIAVAAVLSVTSDVAGAQVLLNGRSIGTVPLTDVEVPAGPAEVAVIKEGFREDSQKINFVVGRDYPIVVKFNVGATKTLAASDRPVDTNLTPGYSDKPGAGVVRAGPSEPITSKWYFWAGIGAGVAIIVGVAAGAAAGSAPRPLTPGDICGAEGCDGCIGLACMAGAAANGVQPLASF